MGIFGNIKHKQIKSFTKGACKSMLISFLAFQDQMKKGKIEAKLFSDLATKALSTRPGWKMIEQNIFEHKSGEKIKIEKSHTLADVILSVVLVETKELIHNDDNPKEIVGIITDEFKKFFSSIPEKEIEDVIKRNKEWAGTLKEVSD